MVGAQVTMTSWRAFRAALMLVSCGLSVHAAESDEEGTFQDCGVCPRMQVIPAGTFVMGEQRPEGETARGWGGPEVTIEIPSPFALARTEVTRAQFQAFLSESGYKPEGSCRAMWPGASDAATAQAWLAPDWPTGERQSDEHPIICINYHDARAYIDWINARVGGRRTYMLPTEAQYEYAARAGTRGPWPWPRGAQDDACRHANVADATYARKSQPAAAFACDDGHAFTSRAGAFGPNAFGVHDLIGNVWEWAQDCAADSHDLTLIPRDGAPLVAAPADCSKRVTRGGGFVSPPWWSRVTARGGGHDPAVRVSAMGFRVAASIDATLQVPGPPPRR